MRGAELNDGLLAVELGRPRKEKRVLKSELPRPIETFAVSPT